MERWSRGWSHDDITQLQPGIVQSSTASDFPHTPKCMAGEEIYSHATEIHPTIFLHNCQQHREKKRRWFTVQRTAENTGAAPCGRNQRWGLLLSHLDWPPYTWSAQPPLSSGLFYVIVLWLSACKDKLKRRTPCSCVSRLWGTASLLRCLITSQTELQRLAMIAA